uniref:Uncharacterized protein n=1 Tax=Rhizophora mucronata TaxID=61149 RepID=A0A2P2NMV8_RHIMU
MVDNRLFISLKEANSNKIESLHDGLLHLYLDSS